MTSSKLANCQTLCNTPCYRCSRICHIPYHMQISRPCATCIGEGFNPAENTLEGAYFCFKCGRSCYGGLTLKFHDHLYHPELPSALFREISRDTFLTFIDVLKKMHQVTGNRYGRDCGWQTLFAILDMACQTSAETGHFTFHRLWTWFDFDEEAASDWDRISRGIDDLWPVVRWIMMKKLQTRMASPSFRWECDHLKKFMDEFSILIAGRDATDLASPILCIEALKEKEEKLKAEGRLIPCHLKTDLANWSMLRNIHAKDIEDMIS